MTFMFQVDDRITLDKITQFVDSKSLDKLVFFVNEVELTKEDKSEYVLERVKACLDSVLKSHHAKALLPIRSLLLRMLESSWGFTELHTYFLKCCIMLEFPREALPILEYTGLFKTMSRSKIAEFLFFKAEIYIKLLDYRRAHETVKKFFTQGYIEATELTIPNRSRLFYMHTVLAISQGEARLHEALDFMKSHSDRIEIDIERMAFGDGVKIDVSKEIRGFKFLYPLKEWRKLNEEESKVMQEYGLTDIYNMGEWKGLGKYINNELKSNNWRLRSSSVKNISLRDWQVTQGANFQAEVYRFDTRDNILYFNHKKATQDTLNQIITKVFTMQREAADCKIERTEGLGAGESSLIGNLMRAASGGRHNKRPLFPIGGGLGGFGGSMGGRGGYGDHYMEEDD